MYTIVQPVMPRTIEQLPAKTNADITRVAPHKLANTYSPLPETVTDVRKKS
jgi:hypothetical protein